MEGTNYENETEEMKRLRIKELEAKRKAENLAIKRELASLGKVPSSRAKSPSASAERAKVAVPTATPTVMETAMPSSVAQVTTIGDERLIYIHDDLRDGQSIIIDKQEQKQNALEEIRTELRAGQAEIKGKQEQKQQMLDKFFDTFRDGIDRSQSTLSGKIDELRLVNDRHGDKLEQIRSTIVDVNLPNYDKQFEKIEGEIYKVKHEVTKVREDISEMKVMLAELVGKMRTYVTMGGSSNTPQQPIVVHAPQAQPMHQPQPIIVNTPQPQVQATQQPILMQPPQMAMPQFGGMQQMQPQMGMGGMPNMGMPGAPMPQTPAEDPLDKMFAEIAGDLNSLKDTMSKRGKK